MLDRAYLAEGMPTLIIWGRHDAIIPLGHGRLAHAAIPGSEFEIFDEAGHFPHHTDPARFVGSCATSWRGTDPGATSTGHWRRAPPARPDRRADAADEMDACRRPTERSSVRVGAPGRELPDPA